MRKQFTAELAAERKSWSEEREAMVKSFAEQLTAEREAHRREVAALAPRPAPVEEQADADAPAQSQPAQTAGRRPAK